MHKHNYLLTNIVNIQLIINSLLLSRLHIDDVAGEEKENISKPVEATELEDELNSKKQKVLGDSNVPHGVVSIVVDTRKKEEDVVEASGMRKHTHTHTHTHTHKYTHILKRTKHTSTTRAHAHIIRIHNLTRIQTHAHLHSHIHAT